MRAAFPNMHTPDAPSFATDQIVINVRVAEILNSFHLDYASAPIAWYQSTVEASGCVRFSWDRSGMIDILNGNI